MHAAQRNINLVMLFFSPSFKILVITVVAHAERQENFPYFEALSNIAQASPQVLYIIEDDSELLIPSEC